MAESGTRIYSAGRPRPPPPTQRLSRWRIELPPDTEVSCEINLVFPEQINSRGPASSVPARMSRKYPMCPMTDPPQDKELHYKLWPPGEGGFHAANILLPTRQETQAMSYKFCRHWKHSSETVRNLTLSMDTRFLTASMCTTRISSDTNFRTAVSKITHRRSVTQPPKLLPHKLHITPTCR